jgi:hypothetical protein
MAETTTLPLPEGWVEKFNKEKGKAFFYNKITKKTQWQRPENNEPATAAAATEAAMATALCPTSIAAFAATPARHRGARRAGTINRTDVRSSPDVPIFPGARR